MLKNQPEPQTRQKRILILGGGFGGVYTARHLEKLCKHRRDIEIVLVSRDNFLLMTPLLFEVCSGTLDLSHCSFPIRAFLGTTRFCEATVENIDLDRRTVRLSAPGQDAELGYDQLVLALGARTNQTMIAGSENSFSFKTLADAVFLRNHMIEQFERADVEANAERKRKLLTFVIVGGGFVGVELFGELTAFADDIMPFYQHVNRAEMRFILLEARQRIMPEIDAKLADYASHVLARRPGSAIRTGVIVNAIEPGKVRLPNETIDAETMSCRPGSFPTRSSPACR
jgi:NADH dehydrogenase